jgi:hypothetical protein
MIQKIYLQVSYYFWNCIYYILNNEYAYTILVVGFFFTTIYTVVKIAETKHLSEGALIGMSLTFGFISFFLTIWSILKIVDLADHKSFKLKMKIEK